MIYVSLAGAIRGEQRQWRYWLDTFHRYHTDGQVISPYAVKLAECFSSASDGGTPGTTTRHVCEIAVERNSNHERWMFIVWDIDVPGIRYCECASRQEAIALYERPDAVMVPTCGVHLSPESRPW